MHEIYINPFKSEYFIPEITENFIVERETNYGFIILNFVPHYKKVYDMLVLLDGKPLDLMVYKLQSVDYPKDNEAVYFTNDKQYAIIYVNKKHINHKIKVTYQYITKNLIREQLLLHELFDIGEPFPLLHKIENNPSIMLCNGARFNKLLYTKLYDKLKTDILPDYGAGFVASETDIAKISKIQKYEYPKIGYVGSSEHKHAFASSGGATCYRDSLANKYSKGHSIYGVTSDLQRDGRYNKLFTGSEVTSLTNYTMSNELAPAFCGVYWYIRAL